MRTRSILPLLGLLLGSTSEVRGSACPSSEIPAANHAAPLTASETTLRTLLPGGSTPLGPDTASTHPPKRELRLPKISGYLQAGYEAAPHSSTFFLRRACLCLTGELSPTLSYFFQFDCVPAQILDARISYRPLHQLGLKAGEYKIPFSIENTIYSPVRFEFIDYPLALTRLMGLNDLCGLRSTGRDLGVSLYGGFAAHGDRDLISYEIGLFNGEGINTRDRNRSKDLAAQLTLSPLHGLRIMASYYRGEYGTEYLRRVRYGAGICYDRSPVVVRSEWIGGETGLPAGADGISGRLLASWGWYAMGGWKVTPTWMPVVRYDTFQEDTSSSRTRQNNCTAGAVWQPVRHLRCQINYTYEQHAARERANRNVVSIQLSGIF